jgi:hypothetical protein
MKRSLSKESREKNSGPESLPLVDQEKGVNCGSKRKNIPSGPVSIYKKILQKNNLMNAGGGLIVQSGQGVKHSPAGSLFQSNNLGGRKSGGFKGNNSLGIPVQGMNVLGHRSVELVRKPARNKANYGSGSTV